MPTGSDTIASVPPPTTLPLPDSARNDKGDKSLGPGLSHESTCRLSAIGSSSPGNLFQQALRAEAQMIDGALSAKIGAPSASFLDLSQTHDSLLHLHVSVARTMVRLTGMTFQTFGSREEGLCWRAR